MKITLTPVQVNSKYILGQLYADITGIKLMTSDINNFKHLKNLKSKLTELNMFNIFKNLYLFHT